MRRHTVTKSLFAVVRSLRRIEPREHLVMLGFGVFILVSLAAAGFVVACVGAALYVTYPWCLLLLPAAVVAYGVGLLGLRL